jgi:hypothetical protein
MPPLAPPPQRLSAEHLRAWRDIVAAAPDVLRLIDSPYIYVISSLLARWRSRARRAMDVPAARPLIHPNA